MSARESTAQVRHRAFDNVLKKDKLTLGFIAPVEGYPDAPWPAFSNHERTIRYLDDIGASALWVRDVPFFDPAFGDVAQVFDPMVYLGWLAAVTRNLAIGTAGIIAPLRDPIIVAKQFASADQISGGRLLAGLASGDRATEYPAFGLDYETRAGRYQESVSIIRALTTDEFPRYESRHYGRLEGRLDLLPKPTSTGLPLIAIGRAGQTLDWLAANVDAWIWHGSDAKHFGAHAARWREATSAHGFKPFGYGIWFDLDVNEDARLSTGPVLRGGRHALIEFLKAQEEAGVNHVALNLKPTRRDPVDLLEELGRYVLPHFASEAVG
ncbi:LLM class oxidoreductase [Paraburkholderia hospita]|uniref:LLM class oxidoreductase n=1 Tax=Paraburkholderia hospita TaxID=169430 RepID=UPI000B3430BA|nr:LLM class oxidoreductase [Paraburkholderia hospita]OUL72743.1 LLM class flavin-dependent oxidoreductase [Paraburkholderia hospita]